MHLNKVEDRELRRWAEKNFRRVELIDPAKAREALRARKGLTSPPGADGSRSTDAALLGAAGVAAAAFAFWWWRSGRAEAETQVKGVRSQMRGLDCLMAA